jgi:hypothetical protein
MRSANPRAVILQRVAHCPFCGRAVDASPLARRENPFCRRCLPARLSAVSKTLGSVRWKVEGEYVHFSTEDSRRPR